MHQTSLISSRITLRFIIIIYMLLFLLGLTASGYFLAGVIQIKPIGLINLLKYILLCFLFLILLVNSFRAMGLKSTYLQRFAEGTKNFKWLFALTFMLLLLFRSGLLKTSNGQIISINNLQLGAVVTVAVFCFWSDTILGKQNIFNTGSEI